MNIFQRLSDVLGLGEQGYESQYEEYAPESIANGVAWQDEYSPSSTIPIAPNNVVGMPGREIGQTEILMVEPRSFEEIPEVVSALKERKSVILNVSLMDAASAQRSVDFVAGGAYAIDGRQERLAETVFLFTPSFVQISNQTPAQAGAIEYPSTPRRPTPTSSDWTDRTRIIQS
ncbi:MAG: cell division protein SepF [Leptolyngbyaceae cyanobacterium RM2_2_4]|nr:cell division protein SepF [Leptolyngbyaceae cyanobacterium SM1_4_3]NJN90868.1 cell division protein SepF [Leptolyngbyaceae cyanobacterium SL_5_14]NJO50782.1 cell division protein SepF [Leptolyngbyaceae cyanobacterium RM2_2_4]NJO66942.1 cell division protein SepF [Leptolyngbyaceae cyanobacterium RM1_405_57]